MPIKDEAARKAHAIAYNKMWRDRIRAVVLEAKKDKPCADCGVRYPPHVLDFHHDNGDKEFQLAQATHSAGPTRFSQVKNELAKCVLLCANCHRLRHGS